MMFAGGYDLCGRISDDASFLSSHHRSVSANVKPFASLVIFSCSQRMAILRDLFSVVKIVCHINFAFVHVLNVDSEVAFLWFWSVASEIEEDRHSLGSLQKSLVQSFVVMIQVSPRGLISFLWFCRP